MLFRSLGRASRKPLRVQLLALRRNGRALTPVDVDASSSSSSSPAASSSTAGAAALVLLLAAASSTSSFSTSARAEAKGATSETGDADVRAQLEKQFPLPDFLKTADDFLFPPLQPFNTGMLPVSKTHSLYYEECGNPYGKVRPPASSAAYTMRDVLTNFLAASDHGARRPRRRVLGGHAALPRPARVPHHPAGPARLRPQHAPRVPGGEHVRVWES